MDSLRRAWPTPEPAREATTSTEPGRTVGAVPASTDALALGDSRIVKTDPQAVWISRDQRLVWKWPGLDREIQPRPFELQRALGPPARTWTLIFMYSPPFFFFINKRASRCKHELEKNSATTKTARFRRVGFGWAVRIGVRLVLDGSVHAMRHGAHARRITHEARSAKLANRRGSTKIRRISAV
jgi:hypothetical protein